MEGKREGGGAEDEMERVERREGGREEGGEGRKNITVDKDARPETTEGYTDAW